jgi:hypothetical protein
MRHLHQGFPLSKLLTIDIETKPAIVFAFDAYDVNISPEQVIEPGGTLCFAAQWVGDKEIMFSSEWEDGKQTMLEKAHLLLSEADAVITYNGQKFDIPKLRGEFILAGLPDIPPPTMIDVYKTVKRFGFMINKLAFIGPLFNLGTKVKHEGFGLWRSVMEGDPKSQARMKKYCIGDVRLTTNLYNRIKGFIVDHPHVGDTKHSCGSCNSDKPLQQRGFRRTKEFKVQRLVCTICGAWSTGTRVKIK